MAVYNHIWSVWTIYGVTAVTSELPDPGLDLASPPSRGLLPPALRRDLADLNSQFLDLGQAEELAVDPRFGWSEAVRRGLASLDGPTRLRMAAAPFAIFRLVVPPPAAEPATRVADLAWAVPGSGWTGRCSSFAHQAAFFARRLCEGAPLAAKVVLDLGPDAQSLLLSLRPSQIAGLAVDPGFVRPRWPCHQRFWQMLEAAARDDSAVAMQWAHCVGVCLLGVDDEAATAPGPRAPRRRPRR